MLTWGMPNITDLQLLTLIPTHGGVSPYMCLSKATSNYYYSCGLSLDMVNSLPQYQVVATLMVLYNMSYVAEDRYWIIKSLHCLYSYKNFNNLSNLRVIKGITLICLIIFVCFCFSIFSIGVTEGSSQLVPNLL